MSSDPALPTANAKRMAAEQKRLRRRKREELRFRSYGLIAIGFAVAALVLLLVSVAVEAVPAFTKYQLKMDVALDPKLVDPAGRRDPADIRANGAGFSVAIRAALRTRFPEVKEDTALRRQLSRLVSTLAAEPLAEETSKHPERIGGRAPAHVPVSDVVDLYLKGLVTPERLEKGAAAASISGGASAVTVSAPGGFTGAYGMIRTTFRKEAEAKEAAARQSETQMRPVTAHIAELQAQRAALVAAGAAGIHAA
ncbi:MAG: DUF3333 domain-containing protein, partial [Alphaproteobacteria bacterium]